MFVNSDKKAFSGFYLDRLINTHFTDLLRALSLRCGQPSQQHGRRFPCLSSCTTLLTCSFRVSSFFTKVVQQIHSLRANGVRSSQVVTAVLFAIKAFFKSAGTVCAVPLESFLLVI